MVLWRKELAGERWSKMEKGWRKVSRIYLLGGGVGESGVSRIYLSPFSKLKSNSFRFKIKVFNIVFQKFSTVSTEFSTYLREFSTV